MYFPFHNHTIHIAKPEQSSSRAARRSGRSGRTPRGRVARFELLERRQLLSITSLDLALAPPVASEGAPLAAVQILHFTDDDPSVAPGSFTAAVALGDPGNTTLTSAANPGNVAIVSDTTAADIANGVFGFDVDLTYTYTEAFGGRPVIRQEHSA